MLTTPPNTDQTLTARTSALLLARAYVALLRVDLLIARRGFSGLYKELRALSARRDSTNGRIEEICRYVDLASVLYFKEVRCLQRSAATTSLLRKEGFSAEVVIGVHTCPFRAHAWVELAGVVVNDKPYISSMYAIIDRF